MDNNRIVEEMRKFFLKSKKQVEEGIDTFLKEVAEQADKGQNIVKAFQKFSTQPKLLDQVFSAMQEHDWTSIV